MYLKAKNIYYKLSDNLSLRLDNLCATMEPVISSSPIVLNDFESYIFNVNYANILIHDLQVKKTIENIISSLFKNLASNVEVLFEPRDILKLRFILGGVVPVNIDGNIVLDKDSNRIIYIFNHLTVMKIPFNSLIDVIKSFPGLGISYKSHDGKASIENNSLKVILKAYVPDLKLNFELSDAYFSETGLILELIGKKISELEEKLSIELPDSYALLQGDSIKVNNVEISNPKVAIFKEDNTPFAFNFATYRDIIDISNIEFNRSDEIILKIKTAT